jgi:hypothetical protein
VLVVQTFLKFPVIQALAPSQTEPPFPITQGLIVLGFLYIGIVANKRFKPELL